MLLSIAKNKKTRKLIYLFIHNAEELTRELSLKISAKKLEALREKLSSETELVEQLITDAYPNNPCFVEYDEVDNGIRVVVFEKLDPPKAVITLEGGLIQDIKTDRPVDVLQLDMDTEGVENNELARYKAEDSSNAEATAWRVVTGSKDSAYGGLNPTWVNQVHEEVLPQLKKMGRPC
jgi:hypothetical protein